MLRHEEHLSGVSLAGITDGTEASLKIPISKLEEIFKTVGVSIFITIFYIQTQFLYLIFDSFRFNSYIKN